MYYCWLDIRYEFFGGIAKCSLYAKIGSTFQKKTTDLLDQRMAMEKNTMHTMPLDSSEAGPSKPCRPKASAPRRLARVFTCATLLGIFGSQGMNSFLALKNLSLRGTVARFATGQRSQFEERELANLFRKDRPSHIIEKDLEDAESFEDDEDDEDDEDLFEYDEITVDSIEEAQKLKPDMDPKFKRKGYFSRKDLERLKASEFDREGVLRSLSIEQLEARLETKYQGNLKFKVERDQEGAQRSERLQLQSLREPEVESDEVDDHDVYYKPMRRLRPARPIGVESKAPGLQRAPAVPLEPEKLKKRPRSQSLKERLLSICKAFCKAFACESFESFETFCDTLSHLIRICCEVLELVGLPSNAKFAVLLRCGILVVGEEGQTLAFQSFHVLSHRNKNFTNRGP